MASMCLGFILVLPGNSVLVTVQILFPVSDGVSASEREGLRITYKS